MVDIMAAMETLAKQKLHFEQETARLRIRNAALIEALKDARHRLTNMSCNREDDIRNRANGLQEINDALTEAQCE